MYKTYPGRRYVKKKKTLNQLIHVVLNDKGRKCNHVVQRLKQAYGLNMACV